MTGSGKGDMGMRRTWLVLFAALLMVVSACTTSPGAGGPPTPTVPGAPAITSANPEGPDALVTFTPAGNGGSSITNYEYQINSGSWTPFAPPAVTSPVTVPGAVVGDDVAIPACQRGRTGCGVERGPLGTCWSAASSSTQAARPRIRLSGWTSAGSTPARVVSPASPSMRGAALFEGSSLPADLTQFDLGLLPLQTVAFSGAEAASLSQTWQAAAPCSPLANRGTGVDNYSAANAVMNALATDLGSTMQLLNGSVAKTNDITTGIPSSPFSAGVTSVRYRNASSITLGASGVPCWSRIPAPSWWVPRASAPDRSSLGQRQHLERLHLRRRAAAGSTSASHTTTQLVKNLIGNGGGNAPGPQVFHYLGNSPAMGLITINAPDGAVYGSPATGGGRYTQLATAVGAGVFMSDSLPPAGLESYVATLLPSHQSAFTGPASTPGTQLAVLSDYLAHGRTLFALADGALATTVRATMDALATGLGSTLQHGGGQHNVDGTASTSQVNGASPFAASVASLAYYVPGDIVGFVGDEWIVKRQAPYTQTILAAQSIGGGRFVYSGDNGLFADGQAHRWGTAQQRGAHRQPGLSRPATISGGSNLRSIGAALWVG